jgi:hypothetical protein
VTPPPPAAADNGEAIVKMATRDNFLPSSPSITPTTHQMNGAHSTPPIASLTSAMDNNGRFVTTEDIANRAENNSNFPPFTGPGALMNLVQRFTNNTVPVISMKILMLMISFNKQMQTCKAKAYVQKMVACGCRTRRIIMAVCRWTGNESPRKCCRDG